MKLMHWQLAVAATTLATVGVGLAWMNDRAQLRRELATLKAPAKDAPAPKLRVGPKPAARNLEKENAEFAARCRTLENDVKNFRAEIERLKRELADAKSAAAPATAKG